MARSLSARQKAILKNYTNVFMREDLPAGVVEDLESINDYETLYHDIDRFLGDQYSAVNVRRLITPQSRAIN